MVSKEQKSKIIDQYRLAEGDTGSVEVQVALLTAKINDLSEHAKQAPKDHSSKRGLFRMVNQRKRFLEYLKSKSTQRYQELIARLGLRK